jgi:hypothetical protein
MFNGRVLIIVCTLILFQRLRMYDIFIINVDVLFINYTQTIIHINNKIQSNNFGLLVSQRCNISL